MCSLIDTVLDINKYFEVQLLIKTSLLFGNCLWSAYYIISDYGESPDLFSLLKTNAIVILWCLSCLTDFCIDIFLYQSLLKEVSFKLPNEIANIIYSHAFFSSLMKIDLSQELMMRARKELGSILSFYNQVRSNSSIFIYSLTLTVLGRIVLYKKCNE